MSYTPFSRADEAFREARRVNESRDPDKSAANKKLVLFVFSRICKLNRPPALPQVFGDEIRIIGSFSQTYCFPRAVAYLDSGKVKVKGMVTDVFQLENFQEALNT